MMGKTKKKNIHVQKKKKKKHKTRKKMEKKKKKDENWTLIQLDILESCFLFCLKSKESKNKSKGLNKRFAFVFGLWDFELISDFF